MSTSINSYLKQELWMDFELSGTGIREVRLHGFIDEAEDVSLPRIGIITPKKIGKAVERNRVRRIVREFFRTNRCLFSKNSDYLFIALPGITDIKSRELMSNMAKILTRRSYNLPGCKNVSFLQKSIR